MPAALYATALLVSAFLIFWLQPLMGRLLLPSYGGSPGVWTTCLLFFQTALLLGYGYAHLLSKLGRVGQLGVHAGLLGLAATALPVALVGAPNPEAPATSLLLGLAASVGAPFTVLSATAPLLQSWYARLGLPDSHDPYRLYAASNLGSLVALLAYPIVMEPGLGLAAQGGAWAVGYGLAVVLLVSAGVVMVRARPQESTAPARVPAKAPGGAVKIRWLVRAFVPASLLYGVTTTISTDVAAVPLLWVLPLALYLLSYVIAFRRGRWLVSRMPIAIGLTFVVLGLTVTALFELGRFGWLGVAFHMIGVFAVSCLIHRDLADERPASEHLTGYFLWLASGGVLAGAFSALGAPVLFDWAVEYPLTLLAALFLMPDDTYNSRGLIAAVSLCTGVLSSVLLVGFNPQGFSGQALGYAVLLLPLAGAVFLGFRWGVVRAFHVLVLGVALGQCALLGAAEMSFRERSFFGVHRVLVRGDFRHYVSGSTAHGRQHLDPARAREAVFHYAPGAPIGEAFAGISPKRVGILGLGVGCLAAYARAGQEWRFFEIDPVVETLAEDPTQFTYLRDARAAGAVVSVVVGDGRLSLERERSAGEAPYDALMLDAFSSDAVPVHLLTEEAFALYADRLATGGLLVVNLSNRYLDLRPLVVRLGATQGLVSVGRSLLSLSEAQKKAGMTLSECVVLARGRECLRALEAKGWAFFQADLDAPLWTDDHANLLGVLKVRGAKR